MDAILARGSSGRVILLIAALLGSTDAALAQFTWHPAAPAPGFEIWSQHGKWEGPWVFRTIDGPPPSTTEVCLWTNPCTTGLPNSPFAHAVMIGTGTRTGQVMLLDENGRAAFWDPANPNWVDSSLYFSPFPGPHDPVYWGAGCDYDIFCSGLTTGPNGEVIIVGGVTFDQSYGKQYTVIFQPPQTAGWTSSVWEPGPDMLKQRYYATVVTMLHAFDGRPLILGGTLLGAVSTTTAIREWERLVPHVGNFHSCKSAAQTLWKSDTLLDPANATEFEYYPRELQLSGASGEFFIAGDTPVANNSLCHGFNNDPGETWFLTPPATGQTNGTLLDGPLDVGERYYGSAVLLHHQNAANGGKDRVIIFGGSEGCVSPDPLCCDDMSVTVHTSVKELDYVTRTLVSKPPLLCERVFSNAVILPTGEIFISRGSRVDPHNYADGQTLFFPLTNPELYDPGTTKAGGVSKFMAAVPDGFVGSCLPTDVNFHGPNKRPPRIYHHIAILLPSGKVLVAGGNELGGIQLPGSTQCGQFGTSGHSGEVFVPPYFFKGFSVAINPSPAPPRQLSYRQGFQIDFQITGSTTATIDRVVFIRTGSVTHHQDYSQRYVEVDYTTSNLAGPTGSPPVLTGTVNASAPGPTLAPPGCYLLFIVAKEGTNRVPSAGEFVRIGP